MGKIPIEEIKKELALAQLPGEAIEELLQVLSMKCLTELEGQLLSLVANSYLSGKNILIGL